VSTLVAIGDCTERCTTWNPKADDPDGEFEYIDLSSVDKDTKSIGATGLISAASAPSRARQLVRAGDILVSTVRPNLNGVALVPVSLAGATASTGFTVLRPRSEVLYGAYLFHWVKHTAFVDEMMRLATGASYPAVSDKIVRESTIPLPPLAEQRRIAAILDKADALRAKRREAITKLDQLVQSVFVEMFGNPIRNEKGYPIIFLAEAVTAGKPITYGILKPGPDIADGVPYIRVVDIRDGDVLVSSVKRTSTEIAYAYRRSAVQTGDILMSIRGHVGRIGVVPEALEGANITQDTARISVGSFFEPTYIAGLLNAPAIQQHMRGFTRGAAVQGINLKDVREIPVPVPSKSEQVRYALAIKKIAEIKRSSIRHLQKADEMFMGLQSKAFAGTL